MKNRVEGGSVDCTQKNEGDEKTRILVVEDDPITCQLLERILTEAGYGVATAQNGKEALALFRKRFFPIVLTDYVMPEMDGLKLCRAIRQKNTKGYVFIALITGMDSKKDIIAGLEAGADDYLTKPINQAELIARLNAGKRVLDLERILKNANEKIKRLTTIDPLTGCYNRSYMMKNLARQVRAASKQNRPLSLIFCDIDHFKKVNDTHGHQIGDRVLNEVVRSLRELIRPESDWITRYGGEEFLIILPGTTPEEAYHLAEAIRLRIAKRKIKIKKESIRLTASFGVTGFSPGPRGNHVSIDRMIREADDKLYESKREGRNRVTI
jgi:diguanylate cyclase (GGDEF)-like protein